MKSELKNKPVVVTFKISDIYNMGDLDLTNRQDPTGGPDHLIIQVKAFGEYDTRNATIPGLKLYYLRSGDESPLPDPGNNDYWQEFGESVVCPISLNEFSITHNGKEGELKYIKIMQQVVLCDPRPIKKFLAKTEHALKYIQSDTEANDMFSRITASYIAKNPIFTDFRLASMIFADIREFVIQSRCFYLDGEPCPEIFDSITVSIPKDIIKTLSHGWDLSVINRPLLLNLCNNASSRKHWDGNISVDHLFNSSFNLYGFYEQFRSTM